MPVLARILLDRGVINRDQLARAIENQVVFGGRLGTNLIELELASEDQIAEALSLKYGVPRLSLGPGEINIALLDQIGRERCARLKVFPHSVQSKTLKLLMVDPSDHVAKAELSYATPYIVRPYVTTEYHMLELLEQYCDLPREWRYEDQSKNYMERNRRRALAGQARQQPEELPPPRPIGIEEALAILEKAESRDEVINAALRLAMSLSRRVIFYIVRRGFVIGWDCVGEDIDRRTVRAQAFPLTEPSVFQTVYENPGPFMGKIPRTDANDLLRKSIEKRKGNSVLVPISLAGRVVNIIYCDAGPIDDLTIELRDLVQLMQRMPEAYRRIIQKRIEEGTRQDAKRR